MQLASDQLPQGIAACSGLTELALQRIGDARPSSRKPDYDDTDSDRARPERLLRTLPHGPYLSRLVLLDLSGNAFSDVPPAVAAVTALQSLDMGYRVLRREKRLANPHYGCLA